MVFRVKHFVNNTKVEFRSETVLKMIEYMLDGREHTASELAEYAGLSSSADVYPRLLHHLHIVEVRRTKERFNLYSLKRNYINFLKNIVEKMRVGIVTSIKKLARVLAGYKLDKIDLKVIQYIINYMRLTKKKWIEASSEEITISEMIAKATGLRSQDVTQSLKTLIQIGLVGKYRRKITLSPAVFH